MSNIPIHLELASGLWIIFTAYVLLNRGLIDPTGETAGAWLVVFPSCLAASILMAADRVDWFSRSVTLIAVFGCVNAIATIAFWLVPSLYTSWFYPVFLSGTYISNAGYMSGLTSHYSDNGMVLALGLVACLSIALRGGPRRSRCWVLFAVTLFAILLTTKRSHLVFGVAACVLAYTAWNSANGVSTAGRLLLAAVFAIFALYVASLYVPEVTAVFERIASLEDDETFGGRSVYYTICLEQWADSPITGSGWDGFTDALYRSGISDLSRLYKAGNLSQDAHNVFLQLLAEEGLVGLALFCAAAAASLVSTIRLLVLENERERPDGAFRASCAGSIAVQAFFVMYCATGNALYTYVEYVPYLLSLSVPLAACGQRTVGARGQSLSSAEPRKELGAIWKERTCRA